jgi:REP element-mobilizing transposase RayT
MGRPKRHLVSEEIGSYHITSYVSGNELMLNDYDKEMFLKYLERFSECFFVQIHAFCIMSSHFHILVSCMGKEAKQATRKELLKRYAKIYPKMQGIPVGVYDPYGELVVPDEDGGTERLRERLGSISRFIQELKQTVRPEVLAWAV